MPFIRAAVGKNRNVAERGTRIINWKDKTMTKGKMPLLVAGAALVAAPLLAVPASAATTNTTGLSNSNKVLKQAIQEDTSNTVGKIENKVIVKKKNAKFAAGQYMAQGEDGMSDPVNFILKSGKMGGQQRWFDAGPNACYIMKLPNKIFDASCQSG